MRTLFLLSGAPGTGKSTLIRELGVENLALGYDMFRKLFSATFPCLDISGLNSETLRMPQEAEYAAVLAAREALKARLAAGTTVFFDSTSSRESDQTELAKLGEKYGYRTVLIDCQGDTTIETLLERNRRRGVDQVDAEVVVEMHERCAAKPVSPLIDSVIDGTRTVAEVNADISKFTKMPTLRIPSGGRVAVVGDVHSCAAALADAVQQMDRPNTHWVFAGDLFDRGPDPVGVMSIVERLISDGRGIVVTGNHEANLRVVNTMYELTRFTDTRTTRTALLNAGISDEQQLAFVNSTVPALHIHFEGRDQPWLVTHGGVGALTRDKIHEDGLLNVSDAECVYGFGERGRTYRGKTSYNVSDIPLVGFQLHGHRNGAPGGEPVKPVTHDRHGAPVICLESGASSGGHISLAELSSDGYYSVHRFDDQVSPELAARNRAATQPAKPEIADPADATALLERMRASEYVTVKPVPGLADVMACNFTRQAFQQGAWDDLTVHARGLFINEATGRIAARGYEKFFHIGEAPGRTADGWLSMNTTSYPVEVRKKYNGYLALVASLNGQLTVFSKSGITPYAQFARQMLLDHLGNHAAEAALAGMLERTNTTAVFEVIAANDTHPITETGADRLVLLDCIRNEVVFRTDDNIRLGISRRFGFEVADAEQTLHSPADLADALASASDRLDEGVVIVDANGYRSKVKASRYAERKTARTALERYWRGTSDTLGQKFAGLEADLRATGILDRITAGEFTVAGVDGNPRLDLARVFEVHERIQVWS